MELLKSYSDCSGNYLGSVTASAAQTSSHTKLGPKTEAPQTTEGVDRIDIKSYAIPVTIGLTIITAFFASFIAILVARGVIDDPPRPLNLFANIYLAGIIIFGGGPIVIPLLREYVVQPGWVSTRDFLIGLAIIQAFPGPNFNFAVYLGALAVLGTSHSTVLGAFLGFMGIFTPGIALAVGFQSLWGTLRHKLIVISMLRGINAAAVGLVFTAVYRLWEIGYLTQETARSRSCRSSRPWPQKRRGNRTLTPSLPRRHCSPTSPPPEAPQLPDDKSYLLFITGREREILSWYFYHGAYSGPESFSQNTLDQYASSLEKPGFLRAMFKPFEALAIGEDATFFNSSVGQSPLEMPVLALSGEARFGPESVLQEAFWHGATNLTVGIVPKAGHWIADENLNWVAQRPHQFFNPDKAQVPSVDLSWLNDTYSMLAQHPQ